MGSIGRGEVWVINLDPGFGWEMRKKRPALIISENFMNKESSFVVVLPISSQVPQAVGPEMVMVGKREGLDKKSVILPLFIRSIDKRRLVKKAGEVSKLKLSQVEEILKTILGLSNSHI